MKITNEMIADAQKFAEAGLNNKQIFEAMGISESGFYNNKQLMESVKKGRIELRQKVSEALLGKAVDLGDSTTLIFLAKRLSLFSTEKIEFDIKTPQKALETLQKIGSSDLETDHKNALKAIVESAIKVIETTELEERIKRLEDGK